MAISHIELTKLLRLGGNLNNYSADILDKYQRQIKELERQNQKLTNTLKDCKLSFQSLVELGHLNHDMVAADIDFIDQAIAGREE